MLETQKREWHQIKPICLPIEPFVWQPEHSPRIVNSIFLSETDHALPKPVGTLIESVEANVILVMSSYRAISPIGSLGEPRYGALYCFSYEPAGTQLFSSVDAIIGIKSNSNLLRRLSFYEVEDEAKVCQFLNRSPELIDLLLEARIRVEQLFGSKPLVILRVVEEPDSPNESELFATVITGLPADEALRRLNAFDDEWWIDNCRKALGKLNFDVERR
ncbi:MAG: hypothetical protein ACYDDI_04960 [Candidatus Acidiferrales bacterium]